MITLHTFGPALGLPDPSPFVVKAEMLLELAGLPYRSDTGGFRRAPRGKLPYIEDDGEVGADSTLIRWHLERSHGIEFDAGPDERGRAVAWSAQKMLEEHTHRAAVRARRVIGTSLRHGLAAFSASRRAPRPGKGSTSLPSR